MPPALPSYVYFHAEMRAGGVVPTLVLFGGSGCSVILEKSNANVLQQVAAFPRERRKS